MRPLMESALEVLLEGRGTPLVLAPTGYGKTRASPEIARAAVREGVARGLVHVVPLRSLVRKIYLEVFAGYPGSGYQMSSPLGDEGKSPYFMRRLVVSTVDSYLWNLFRVPVLEYLNMAREVTSGHYYPVAASLLSSVNVLDEAHVYLGEGSTETGTAAVLAATQYLAYTGTPTLVETATMHPQLIARLASALRRSGGKGGELVLVAWECLARALSERYGLRVRAETVREEPDEAVGWETSIVGQGWSSGVLREIAGLSREGPVLVVANTVRRAVRLYEELSGIADTEVVLVHGRLAEEDRREAEERAARVSGRGEGIIVATQVVEVGVDVNSIAVYTDAAPAENLVQRAGRACRRGTSLDWCRENWGRVTIVLDPETAPGDHVYSEDSVGRALAVVSTISAHSRRGLDWRAPCPGPGARPYYDLIAIARPRLQGALRLARSFREYLRSDGRPLALLEMLDRSGACHLYRETIMVPIMTERGPVLASLNWALRGPGRKYLDTCDGAPCLLAIREEKPCGEAPARRLLEALAAERCSMITRALLGDLAAASQGCPEGPVSYALRARRDAYRRGVGLV